MADIPAEAQPLIEAALKRFDSLDARINELRRECGSEEDGEGVSRVLEVFEQLAARGRSLCREQEFAMGVEPDGLVDSHLQAITACVLAVERAMAPSLGAIAVRPKRDLEPLIRPLVRLAQALTQEDETELIFTAVDHFDYGIASDAFEHARSNFMQIIGAEPLDELEEGVEGDSALGPLPTLAIISYPARADSDTLMHALFGHELAHLVLDRSLDGQHKPLLDELFEAAYDTEQVDDEDAEAAHEAEGEKQQAQEKEGAADAGKDDDSEEGAGGHRDGSVAEKEDQRAARLKSWLNELTCDLVGIWIMGPAFLFALVDYVFPEQGTHLHYLRKYDTHPSMVWRLERLLPEAKKFFPEVAEADPDEPALTAASGTLESYATKIELYKRLNDSFEPESEAADRELLEAALTTIEDRKAELVPTEALFGTEILRADLPLVWEKLDQGIAPAERVRERVDSHGRGEWERAADSLDDEGWSLPINWRSILNGIYLYHLCGKSRTGPLAADEDQRSSDAQMARGSIELAELLRRMQALDSALSPLFPKGS